MLSGSIYPIFPVPVLVYHIFPLLSSAKANGRFSFPDNVISSNSSFSGKYFTILSLLTMLIQIFPSKSALINSGVFFEITGSSFGIVFVVICFVSGSMNPI